MGAFLRVVPPLKVVQVLWSDIEFDPRSMHGYDCGLAGPEDDPRGLLEGLGDPSLVIEIINSSEPAVLDRTLLGKTLDTRAFAEIEMSRLPSERPVTKAPTNPTCPK